MTSTLERRQHIVNQVTQTGNVNVEQLALDFKVSAVTIRSDLNYLDNKGLLVRTRGGAVAHSRLTKELSLQEKRSKNLSIKQAIGVAAAKLVNENESIILDSGTTTAEIAVNLQQKRQLTVLTNGLNIATQLSGYDALKVMITGGTLRHKSQSFYGRLAEQSLPGYRFDKLFLGVDGFDIDTGLTTHFEPEANLNRLMCQASQQIIVVTDSSKFSRSGLHVICACEQIDTLITDSRIPEQCQNALERQGIKIILVPV